MKTYVPARLWAILLMAALAVAASAWRRGSHVPPPHDGSAQAPAPSGRQPTGEEPPRPCAERRPEPTEPAPDDGTPQSNYVTLSDFKSVLVTDSYGDSYAPLSNHPGGHATLPRTGRGVATAVYDRLLNRRVMITSLASETLTYTFRRGEHAGTINLVRGVGNASPDTAMRYNDLVLPEGATAMLRVTPGGIEPLRLDGDGDGTFEAEVKPHAYVTGPAARDVEGPTFCFSETRRGGKALVIVTAVDSSGVGDIYYSLDPVPEKMDVRDRVPMTFRLYDGPAEADASRTRVVIGPIEVDVSRAPEVSVYSDDKIGNRGYASHRVKGRE